MAERFAPNDYDGVWDAAPLERELLNHVDRLVGRRMPSGLVHPHAAISGGRPARSTVATPHEIQTRWPFCTNQAPRAHRRSRRAPEALSA